MACFSQLNEVIVSGYLFSTYSLWLLSLPWEENPWLSHWSKWRRDMWAEHTLSQNMDVWTSPNDISSTAQTTHRRKKCLLLFAIMLLWGVLFLFYCCCYCLTMTRAKQYNCAWLKLNRNQKLYWACCISTFILLNIWGCSWTAE